MASFEQVEILMEGIGPILDPLAIDFLEEAQAWAVAIEEDIAVLIQFDDRKNCLVLTTDLGSPPAGDRTALYETLMQLNYHWDATGGVRMAVDQAGGDVMQIYEISAENMDFGRLAETIAAFAAMASAWRRVVERPSSAESVSPDTSSNFDMRV